MMAKNLWGKKETLPLNPCETCGQIIAPRHHKDKRGRFKGWYVPLKYCSNSCAGKAQIPSLKAKGKGSRDRHGYRLLSRLNSNQTDNRMYQQPEHRFVMEQKIGRKLHKNETVHHKDGNRANNHPDNLELWDGRHGRGQRVGEQDIWSGMIPKWVLEDHSPY